MDSNLPSSTEQRLDALEPGQILGIGTLPGEKSLESAEAPDSNFHMNTTPHLCRSRVKQTALDLARVRKLGNGQPRFTRVSAAFLERIEGRLRAIIGSEIHQHPSVGRTLM